MLPAFKTFAMNFAEPSGSSPAEKPPERARICVSLSSLSSSSKLSASISGFLLRRTRIFVLPPARLNARAISISQFVPGNTGSNTFGDVFG